MSGFEWITSRIILESHTGSLIAFAAAVAAIIAVAAYLVGKETGTGNDS